MYRDHKFAAIGLSELFEIQYKDEDQLNEVNETRKHIRDVLLDMLKQESSCEWRARLDDHHLYIYKQSLNCKTAEYLSLGVQAQPWRKIQHFAFHPPGCAVPLHVYHCHCPAAGKKKQGATDRRFLPHARKTVVKTICNHMQKQHTSQVHRGVAQPDFPAVLLTGDYNLSEATWRGFLMESLPIAVQGHVHVLKSTRTGKYRHGDLSIAINAVAKEMETPDWTKFF